MSGIRDEISEKRSSAAEHVAVRIENVQEKADYYLSTNFPRFRLRAMIVTSLTYLSLMFFSLILSSFGLSEGVDIFSREELMSYLLHLGLVRTLLPLLFLNGFIWIYLKSVHEQYYSYFQTRTIKDEEAYWKAVAKFDRLNPLLNAMVILLFLGTEQWAFSFGLASSGYAFFFYTLSQITLVGITVTLNYICLNLFVRRRLLYVLDVYEMKTKLKLSQKQLFSNTLVTGLLLLNGMAIFSDLSIRVMYTEGMMPDVKIIAGGYFMLSFFLLIQAAVIYTFLGILRGRQMRDLHRKMSDLAEGSGDLTKQIRILEIDDMGIIISHLNKFVGNLKEKLLIVQNATTRVTNSSDTLFDELQNTSAATEEMVASVEQINRTTGNRASLVEQTGEDLRSMIDSLNQVKNSVDTQATFVEQTSSAINQMAASIQSVSQATGKANDLSNHLSEAASAGGKAVNDSIAAVRDVETSSEEVNNLVSTITKIASQTNMLAMNAAIEAAHAGDAGRGFAVVAEEVRNLAENSSDSAKLITDQIQQMVGVVNNGVQMSENAGEALEKVVGDIRQTTEVINGIALAMDEQNAGATEILNSISSLIEATQVIKKISQEEMNKNEDMQRSIDQVIQAFQEIRLSTEEQTQGTKDMIHTVSQLQDVAQDNQEVVKILSEAFAGFKLS
jgi:methyl-accepting chemotaxis protein